MAASLLPQVESSAGSHPPCLVPTQISQMYSRSSLIERLPRPFAAEAVVSAESFDFALDVPPAFLEIFDDLLAVAFGVAVDSTCASQVLQSVAGIEGQALCDVDWLRSISEACVVTWVDCVCHRHHHPSDVARMWIPASRMATP